MTIMEKKYEFKCKALCYETVSQMSDYLVGIESKTSEEDKRFLAIMIFERLNKEDGNPAKAEDIPDLIDAIMDLYLYEDD